LNHTIKAKSILSVLIGCGLVAALAIAYIIFSEPKMITVGIARWGSNPEYDRSIEGFKEGLALKGYIEGENIQFIEKNPEADLAKQRKIIEGFIHQQVDLIFTLTTPGTSIAKELTEKMQSPIPVVFSVCTYPVESDLIASLDNSENNLVGTRNYVPFAKQYYIFEQLFPDTKSLAVVRRKGESNSTNQLKEVKAQLEERGITIIDIAAVDLEDIQDQLQKNAANIDAIFSTCDTLTHDGGEEIISEFGKRHKIPSFACNKEGVINGLLVGNVGDFKAIATISGEQAGLILDGAAPAWLKTESPRDSYIVLNSTTANLLKVNISPGFIDRVKEITK
jgi:putative ABC transport system substrate-binding protein